MQGSSRAAAVGSREAFTGVLAAGADRSRLAEELFAVVALLDSNVTLRRAVADPSHDAARKTDLAERLFASRVGAEALVVLKGVVGQRWSSERDLSDTLERYAVEAVIADAESSDSADQVEDELFRFERIVAADPNLRTALSDSVGVGRAPHGARRLAARGSGDAADPGARTSGRRRAAGASLRLHRARVARDRRDAPRAADRHRHLGGAAG